MTTAYLTAPNGQTIPITLSAPLSWTAAASAGLSQAQSTTGTGATFPINAQAGKAGSVGGILKIGGGAAGTPGSQLAGATQIDLGTTVAGVSAKLQIFAAGATILDVSQTAASVLTFASASTLVIAPGNLFFQPTGFTSIEPAGDLYIKPTTGILHYQQGGVEYCTLTIGASPSIVWGATATLTDKQADLTTNSATGHARTIAAQNATGTTSTGGDLVLQAGTGTSANGAVNINNVATTATAPGAGGGGALPATPVGYVTLKINGTARKIPYY